MAPKGFAYNYETSLYNLEEHRLLQSSDNWVSYYVIQESSKLIAAEIHFHILNFAASSPCKSPFGSVDSSEELQPKVLFKFLEFIESSLRTKGMRKILIKNPPQVYQHHLQILLETFLLNLNYQITNAEVGAVLNVNNSSGGLRLDWRKLKQAREENLELKHHFIEQLSEIYLFIQNCHKEKGYSTSMTLVEMQKLAGAFPERILLTSVYHQNERVAACISVRSRSKVLNHFYSNHSRSADQFNPAAFLIKGLYEYALKNRFEFLDLGTSAIDGYPNFGLLNFKLRAGATLTSKYTFEKILN